MGMFDYFKIVSPSVLPVKNAEQYRGVEFQTKDFNCLLDEYQVVSTGTILKNGALFTDTLMNINFYTDRNGWVEFTGDVINGKLTNVKIYP